MRKSKSHLPDADWRSLKGQLTRALDMTTGATGTEGQLQALLQPIISSYSPDLVRACLAEIQRDCDEQITVLEHRLGMLVELQAEISRQCNPPDPRDLLSSYLKRLRPG